MKPASGPAAASVVELSEAAQVVPRDSRPSITARIEKIRGLIERGTYPIDLDVLASRIVDDEVGRASKAS